MPAQIADLFLLEDLVAQGPEAVRTT